MPGKHHLRGFKIAPKKSARRFAARKIGKKNRLAASRLVKSPKKSARRFAARKIANKKSARRYAARGRWVKPPPPWKKARSAPECGLRSSQGEGVVPQQWNMAYIKFNRSWLTALKALFNNVSTIKQIWAAGPCMLPVSVTGCKNEALEKTAP